MKPDKTCEIFSNPIKIHKFSWNPIKIHVSFPRIFLIGGMAPVYGGVGWGCVGGVRWREELCGGEGGWVGEVVWWTFGVDLGGRHWEYTFGVDLWGRLSG